MSYHALIYMETIDARIIYGLIRIYVFSYYTGFGMLTVYAIVCVLNIKLHFVDMCSYCKSPDGYFASS